MKRHDSNCHFNAILDLHRKRGVEREFLHTMGWYLAYGYVIATPEFFAVYRPVRLCAATIAAHEAVGLAEAEAWFIHSLAGDMGAFGKVLPNLFPWVGFSRSRWKTGEFEIKWVRYSRLHQLIYHHNAMTLTLLPEPCF